MVMDQCSCETPRYELCRKCEGAATRRHAAAPPCWNAVKKPAFPQPARGFKKMKLFSCQGCGQLLYFENIRCESCGRALGYLTDLNEISALEPAGERVWRALAAPHRPVKFCGNYDAGMCNWLVDADDPEGFCL